MAESWQTFWSKGAGGPQAQLSGVTITGTEELARALKRFQGRIPHAALRALNMVAEEIMTEAKTRTPVDTGNLRASGHVHSDLVGPWAVATLAFGGVAGSGYGQNKDVGYAVYVHEDLLAFHHVGQAKFLESAVLDAIPRLSDRMAALLRAELR